MGGGMIALTTLAVTAWNFLKSLSRRLSNGYFKNKSIERLVLTAFLSYGLLLSYLYALKLFEIPGSGLAPYCISA